MDDLAPVKLVIFPDPILAATAVPYEFGSLPSKQLAERIAGMIAIMVSERGAGIAAPQVGWSTRICVVPSAIEGCPPRIMINPEIIFSSEEKAKAIEGCLSVPGVFAAVRRPREVEVGYFDESGQFRQFTATGLVAQCLQHEIDHLDGVLFMKRAEGAEQRRAYKEARRLRLSKGRV